MQQHFDRDAWRARCRAMAESANVGCGLVYEVFEQRLCASIEHALRAVPQAHRDEAVSLARAYGYITSEEAAASSTDSVVGNDYCHHGIPPKWCPVGCGDVE
ncbi:hypothetical protein QRO08_11950 [Paracidovorax citrulli]|nr:hypothetical protein [Paracidovorax citrulli]MVT28878.1 hypothetical protein [Paracidovorax citrulli]MVT36558.1 hypothetical protein [Paracidovorax citrulli]UMT83287.1 hypothetical protein FRC75_07845 [Paracidovorax citrulli]WIY31615.1 hypothetical protein QRO09_07830 [Paracidovorax citrulli]WIY40891.1 hypothetical protein QRO10_08095 [Paracidovorax citrulli]